MGARVQEYKYVARPEGKLQETMESIVDSLCRLSCGGVPLAVFMYPVVYCERPLRTHARCCGERISLFLDKDCA